MKKYNLNSTKIIVIVIVCLMAVFLSIRNTTNGAERTSNDKVSVTQEEMLGIDNLVKIGNGLYYDKATNIVYFWNGSLGKAFFSSVYMDTAPSPYYAPNGFPYKYNVDTNSLELIETE